MYFTRSAGAVSVTGIEKVKKLTVRGCGAGLYRNRAFYGYYVAGWFGGNPHGFPMCQSRGTPLMHRRCKDGVYSICRDNQYA